MPWYKGNFHCHSTNSDGTASPTDVAFFYKSIGMDFCTVSDHNMLTSKEEYREALSDDFIGIDCCEYTGEKYCHVLGVDVNGAVAPSDSVSGRKVKNDSAVVEILQDGIDQVRKAGGVAVLCHPCWNWAFTAEEVLQLKGVTHFEVFNAAPDCNSYPTGERTVPEQIWDRLLSSGLKMYGVASDDAHWYSVSSAFGCSPKCTSFGGTGWCVIKAKDRSRESIRNAFENGHFYASTGVVLSDYRVTAHQIDLEVAPKFFQSNTIEFRGLGGNLLARQTGPSASYRMKGDEKYVRVRVADSSGCFAFTQPVFLDTIDDAVRWTGAL